MIFSEIFKSQQSEGIIRIGVPAIYIRFFTCNLQCFGFGQTHPTKKETWEDPWKSVDFTKIQKLEDLPLMTKGCDSSYSWSAKVKSLQHNKSVHEVVDMFEELLQKDSTSNKFNNPNSLVNFDLIFTGGEPLLPANQKNIVEIINELEQRNNLPNTVQIETNGTQKIGNELLNVMFKVKNWQINCSPKLFSVSGEENKKAIKYYAISDLIKLTDTNKTVKLQFKFVVNDTQECWNELDYILEDMYKYNPLLLEKNIPVSVMPVGADAEQVSKIQRSIAEKAIKRGLCFTTRLQNFIWDNGMGT